MAGLRVFISLKQIIYIAVQTSTNLYFNLKDTLPLIRQIQLPNSPRGFRYFFYMAAQRRKEKMK